MSKYIKIKTKIPGPKSIALMKEKEKHISSGVPSQFPIFVKEAKGALIKDVDDNIFLDFYGGVGATNSGHSNKFIISAVKKQADKFFHTCFSESGYESYIRLCKKLNEITPGNFRKKSALFNSGAEAIENAVKLARRATGRQAVVSFEHGFHGRTLLTMSLTSKIKPYKFGFGPFAPEVYKLPYPYVYRRPSSCITEDEYVDYLLENIEETFFNGVVDPENIACIVMELVTGEGGFIVAPKRYVKELSKLCKKNGIVLIIDEVQSGFGRTGKLFATEHYEIEPDIICTAKSLSNGLPLSAITGREDIMDNIQIGGFGGTFSGNPLSCEAALAAVDFILKNKLSDKAMKIGSIVMNRFEEIQDQTNIVGDVRGLGAMCALEFVKNRITKEPNKEKAEEIAEKCYKNGVLLLYTGILGNDIRTLMPLVIQDDQLNEGLDVIETTILD